MILFTFARRKRQVFALAPGNGTVIWQQSFEQPFTCVHTAPERAFFLGMVDARLISLAVGTGAWQWSYSLPDASPLLSLAANEHSVFGNSQQGNVYALDVQQGTLRWQHKLSLAYLLAFASTPILLGVTPDDLLIAMNAHNGQLLWRKEKCKSSTKKIVLLHNKLYVLLEDAHSVLVLDSGSGEEVKRLRGDNFLAIGDILYVNDAETGFSAWHTQNDTLLWHEPSLHFPLSAGNNSIAYATASLVNITPDLPATTPKFISHVYALDLATHTLKWHWQEESMGISSHPVVIGENICFTTGRGGVYALRGSDGAELWHVLLEYLFPSDPLVG